MKKIIITVAAVAAAFTFASCEKDNTISEENGGKTILFASTADASLTRTELAGNDTDGYQVVWSAGDKIKLVRSGKYTDEYTLINGAGTADGTFECSYPLFEGETYDAYYPFSGYVADIYDPNTYTDTYVPDWVWNQTYVEGNVKDMPMSAQFTVSGGEPSSLKFKNDGGILRLKVKNSDNVSLKSITISSGNELTSAVDNSSKSIVLDCGASGVTLSSTGTEFSIAMPAGEYSASNFKMEFTNTDGKTKTMKMASKPMVITRSQITAATITVDFTEKKDNALSYAFQINASGDKVVFSKGNLYWDGDSFEFEDAQMGGCSNTWSADHVTQFFWSNSASIARGSSYSDASAAATDVLFTNATETTANSGFTVAGETGKWRTLSKDECVYLKTNYGVRYVYMGGYGAMILFPKGITYTSIANKSEVTETKWADLEAKGCVAFPMVWDEDRYWTSTSVDETTVYANYIAVFSSWTHNYEWMIGVNQSIFDLWSRSLASRIRLVKDYTE